MKTNLQVPFAEKDEAKRLGAKWDAARKVWYVENVEDLYLFAKWIPSLSVNSSTSEPPQMDITTKKQQSAGITIVGSNYVERPRICDCLPWDVCDKCESSALKN